MKNSAPVARVEEGESEEVTTHIRRQLLKRPITLLAWEALKRGHALRGFEGLGNRGSARQWLSDQSARWEPDGDDDDVDDCTAVAAIDDEEGEEEDEGRRCR